MSQIKDIISKYKTIAMIAVSNDQTKPSTIVMKYMQKYGYKVFLASFGSFLTGRYDIIRCSLAYPNQPVVLVGTHVGMAIGKDGVTQMGLEDVSIMRALPNMSVLNPASFQKL